MKDNNGVIYSIPFSSMDYYSRKSLQFKTSAINKTVTKTTTLKNNDGITFLYFRNGSGKIIINTRERLVQRGCLMALASYHYFQITPDSGSLDVTECHLSYETFLYMAANPYYKFEEINLQVIPLTSFLDEEMISRTENVLDELVGETRKQKHKDEEVSFFLIMRLMGIMQKTFIHDIWRK